MTTTNTDSPRFNRKEREHLAVLQRRLDYLTGDHPERRADPSYVPGEVQALSWILAVIAGTVEPVEVRLNRFERKLREVGSRLARLEYEEDDDETA